MEAAHHVSHSTALGSRLLWHGVERGARQWVVQVTKRWLCRGGMFVLCRLGHGLHRVAASQRSETREGDTPWPQSHHNCAWVHVGTLLFGSIQPRCGASQMPTPLQARGNSIALTYLGGSEPKEFGMGNGSKICCMCDCVGFLPGLACSTTPAHEAVQAEVAAALGHGYSMYAAGSDGSARLPRIPVGNGLAPWLG